MTKEIRLNAFHQRRDEEMVGEGASGRIIFGAVQAELIAICSEARVDLADFLTTPFGVCSAEKCTISDKPEVLLLVQFRSVEEQFLNDAVMYARNLRDIGIGGGDREDHLRQIHDRDTMAAIGPGDA